MHTKRNKNWFKQTPTKNEQIKPKHKLNQTKTTWALSQPNQHQKTGWVGVSPNKQFVSLNVYVSQMKALPAKKVDR